MAAGQYKNKAYPLRINGTTLETVKGIAEANNISANKQIELILEDYIRRRDTSQKVAKALISTSKPPKAILTKVNKRIK